MTRPSCAILSALTLLACTSSPSISERSAPSSTTAAQTAEPDEGDADPRPVPDPAGPKPANADDRALASLNAILVEALRAQQANDHAGARSRISTGIDRALVELEGRDDEPAWELLHRMGRFAHDAGELRAAERARRRVFEVCSRTLPDDHADLQVARSNLAGTLKMRGDLQGARALEQHILDVYSRSLPDDHPDVQLVRHSLGVTLDSLGDLSAALELFEKVLEVRSRTLPEDDLDLQASRQSVAITLYKLGDLSGARALFESVVAVYSRTLPDDHRNLQRARLNLAATVASLGDLPRARALFEKVLEVRLRTLPDDHPELQRVRGNLAGVLYKLGDLPGARSLQEKVLEVQSRALPEDHNDLQSARTNLALTLTASGDLAGARELCEKALDVRSRTLPEDHIDLQAARESLAYTMKELGDFRGAEALEEQVLEVRTRTLPEDHALLQAVRTALAATLKALGEIPRARELEEAALGACSRTLPEQHPDLLWVRQNLAFTIALQAALASRESPEAGHAEWDRCLELIRTQCRSHTAAARAALLEGSPREAEARCGRLAAHGDQFLSFAEGFGVFPASAELEALGFVLLETIRGATLSSAATMRLAASSPRYAELKRELREKSGETAALARMGTTSEEFLSAVGRRESVERELVALAGELSEATPPLDLRVGELRSKLAPRDALVTYRRYERVNLEAVRSEPLPANASALWSTAEHLCAFVLRGGEEPDATDPVLLARLDLGPIAPIETAVREWREGVGSLSGRGVGIAAPPTSSNLGESGETIRRLVFDPLAESLAGVTRVIVVPDDVLHLVPFDALPQRDSAQDLLGDTLRIETRATVTELMSRSLPTTGRGGLVAVGDVAFDGPERVASADALARLDATGLEFPVRELPSVLRGGSFGGFDPLPATGAEIEALTQSFGEQFGLAEAMVLRHDEATRDRWIELVPQARWLHVATHGWFASESIRSWQDPEPIDEYMRLGIRRSGAEEVKGMSPMLLCGLALAGANLPDDAVGRAPGLITADEISTLDLSNCELAVLSACDTNVGERRAGQGVASLQRALQMAGARSVITSLWKVPDEATKELMVDFYRRLWIEKKPKHQALWEAKKKLRGAKDERGQPLYTTSDWAAWVLTGAPD